MKSSAGRTTVSCDWWFQLALELQFQRELAGAGTADLVEWTYPAIYDDMGSHRGVFLGKCESTPFVLPFALNLGSRKWKLGIPNIAFRM